MLYKKRNWLVPLLCLCLFAQPALSQDTAGLPRQSLNEMRASLPPQYIFRGKGVEIAAPLQLPEGTALPVRILKEKTYTDQDLKTMNAMLSRAKENAGLKASTDISRRLLNIGCKAAEALRGSSNPWPKGYSLDFRQWDRLQPENNSVPPEAPYARISALLNTLFPDVQFFLSGQHATTGGRLVREETELKPLEELLKKPPQRGFEKGHYYVEVGQKLNGICVFPDRYFRIVSPQKALVPAAGFKCTAFFNEKALNLSGTLVLPGETLTEDAQLVPFDRIARVIQARIQTGHIRTIDSIRLCYLLYFTKPVTMRKAFDGQVELVGIPTWEISGTMAFDPIRSPGLVAKNSKFCIDALTGLPLDRYADPAPDVYPMESLTR